MSGDSFGLDAAALRNLQPAHNFQLNPAPPVEILE
jgi:hypothetical protein